MFVPIDIRTLPVITLFGHVSFKKPWKHMQRQSNEYMLYFIKDGELNLIENNIKYSLKKGDIFVLEPGYLQDGFEKACCDYYFVHFRQSPMEEKADDNFNDIAREILDSRTKSLNSSIKEYEFDDSLIKQYCYFPKQYTLSNQSLYSYVMNTLEDALQEYNRKYEHYRSLFACRFTETLIRVSREYVSVEIEKNRSAFTNSFVKVEAVLNYLNRESCRKVTSKELAAVTGTNYDYLNRVFKKMTGYTIFSYLNLIRINKAREFIMNTSMPLLEVACHVGIDDPYYFSKTFKKYTGFSPTEFRVHYQKYSLLSG